MTIENWEWVAEANTDEQLAMMCDDERDEGELFGMYGEEKRQERIRILQERLNEVIG